MAKTTRVFQLARELGVTSKDIVEKCQAEEISDIKNHMSAVSLGLAERIREWFSDGGGTARADARLKQMKLMELRASRYRSLREETIHLTDLNVFIGPNASGKSTILDALRFLHDGLRERDFRPAVFSRGGIVHLAWKGEEAQQIELVAQFKDADATYQWTIRINKHGYGFAIHEDVSAIRQGVPPTQLLSVERGAGWWWSGANGDRVKLQQSQTTCALAAAAADATFPARTVAEFVNRWGFFDPSPFLLRRGWSGFDPSRFDSYGRNLAEHLYALRESSPQAFEQIISATQSVLGLPTEIELRRAGSRDDEEIEDDVEDRFYFVQNEPGLRFRVHQIGASSGTLRMLALMTALFGRTERNLIGIEEPENHVHPTALASFAEYLLKARERVQILVTTHSPLLLDFLNEPTAVCVVRHTEKEGTRVLRETNEEGVRRALAETGFGLGEFHETKGFGG